MKEPQKEITRKTVKEVFEEYCEYGRSGKAYTTIKKQDSLWKNHIKDRFGSRYVDDISVAEINDYLAELYYEDNRAYSYTQSFLKVQEMLLQNGIMFDKTPFIDNERGKEIKQYLSEHRNIEDYILLDDVVFSDFDDELLSHLIKMDDTNTRGIGKGLQKKDIEEIIRRFGRKKDFKEIER